jgi:hypothetical protein
MTPCRLVNHCCRFEGSKHYAPHRSKLQEPSGSTEQVVAEVMNKNITRMVRRSYVRYTAILTGLRYRLAESLYTKYVNVPSHISRSHNFLLFYTYD